MARIIITKSNQEVVRLTVGELRCICPVGAETVVPDELLPALRDSNNEFEILQPVAGPEEAEVGARGDSGDASAEAPPPPKPKRERKPAAPKAAKAPKSKPARAS